MEGVLDATLLGANSSKDFKANLEDMGGVDMVGMYFRKDTSSNLEDSIPITKETVLTNSKAQIDHFE